jgi:UDP-N-acetylglucosamine--N-acetylmuramyl-(pentapeptide) pyrophosphoryl-undecaprenol N-acetylglucosamine transferase
MRVLITCSGTAGHINPALAIADEIVKTAPGTKIMFIGAGRRLENKLIPEAGYPLENIRISGFARGFTPKQILNNIKTLSNIATAQAQTGEIIKRFRPDVAVGTGGYVCYPVLRKAAHMGIPTVIHESNAIPGLTTQLLAGIVDKILVAFPDVSGLYPRPEKVQYTGTPVRSDFLRFTKNEARLKLGIDGRPLVVSYWGSLGAENMNNIITDFIPLNMESRLFNHIHATGGTDAIKTQFVGRLKQKISGVNIPPWIDIRTYIDNMPLVMTAADLILCRSGASTMAELTALGKPAIMVPSPNVTNNHQEKNAQRLAKTGGVVSIVEKDCTGELLYSTVKNLLTDKARLALMSEAMRNAGVPDAASGIVGLIISMCD